MLTAGFDALFRNAPIRSPRPSAEASQLTDKPTTSNGSLPAALKVASRPGGVAGMWVLSRGRRPLAVLLFAFSTLVAAQLVLGGHDTLAESRSSAPLVAKIVAREGPFRTDVPFYTVHMYDQTLPYYLGRTVIQVEHPDELAMGIASEPDKAIDTIAHWLTIWDAVQDAYAMMQPDEYDSLRRDGVRSDGFEIERRLAA